MYNEFMHEYFQLGHMEEISDRNRIVSIEENIPVHYLPHHSVWKLSSTTTKLRVVFNAATPDPNKLSLNDCLCVGPNVQDELFSILLRFCQHQFVCVADIQMMYRQVLVDYKDCELQRILWREDPLLPLKEYSLKTVTYGTAPASFLATRCLKELSIENKEKFPVASNIFLKDFYMDDLMTGFEDVSHGLQIQKEITNILSLAGFHLRKWMSNDQRLLKNIDLNDQEFLIFHDPSDFIKTLGLCWKPAVDRFTYKVVEYNPNLPVTKTSILSTIARWYDPLGKTNPVILVGKIIMQKLWAMKVDWDDPG
jgi:hypothetical protein